MSSFNLKIDKQFFEDISLLKAENPKLGAKVWELIEEILNNSGNPLFGRGKPEALRGNLAGYYSRHISEKHRLIYRFESVSQILYLVSCYGHYDDK